MGDLRWLTPYHGEPPHCQALEYSTETRLQCLKVQARMLKVEIPEAFLKPFSDEALQRRIVLEGGGYYIELGDCLRKCVRDMQDDGEAYLIRFFSDQQGGYWSLYLDAGPENRHCLLSSGHDPNHEQADAYREWLPNLLKNRYDIDIATEMRNRLNEGNIKVAWVCKDDSLIASCNLEEWLAKIHWMFALDRACHEEEDCKLGDVEEEYVRRNFSKGCR